MQDARRLLSGFRRGDERHPVRPGRAALSTAAAFEIDDVIDPADTRAVLIDVLARVTTSG